MLGSSYPKPLASSSDTKLLVTSMNWEGWYACKQGKVSVCGQRGDHQEDPCLAVFKLVRSLLVAISVWHSSILEILTDAGNEDLDIKFGL